MLSHLDQEHTVTQLNDVLKQLDTIHDATKAMEAISSLLMPVMLASDEQLNHTTRSQVALVFKFFAEAMQNPLGDAMEAIARLELQANKREDS